MPRMDTTCAQADMPGDGSGAGGTSTRLPEVLAGFAQGFNARHTTTHAVSSPLGWWLLLALAAPAVPAHRSGELADALGCDPSTAHGMACDLVADPHPAVGAAVAVWSSPRLLETFGTFTSTLPRQVERGPIPSQAQADAWAGARTKGLIETFPISLQPDTLLVLASALATDVSWTEPLERAEASDLGGDFGARATHALVDRRGFLANTAAAGLVAVSVPASSSGLDVYSVVAAPDVEAAAVHAAAHEVATGHAGVVDLFDLDLGQHHAWTLTESVQSRPAGRGSVSEYEVFLPPWSASSDHDLGAEPGLGAIGEGLAVFAGPADQPVAFEAKQVAVAEFTATGFKAAAITAVSMRAGSAMPAFEEVPVRRATIRLNRPYAVLAVASQGAGLPVVGPEVWDRVPVFSAWVTTPD